MCSCLEQGCSDVFFFCNVVLFLSGRNLIGSYVLTVVMV